MHPVGGSSAGHVARLAQRGIHRGRWQKTSTSHVICCRVEMGCVLLPHRLAPSGKLPTAWARRPDRGRDGPRPAPVAAHMESSGSPHFGARPCAMCRQHSRKTGTFFIACVWQAGLPQRFARWRLRPRAARARPDVVVQAPHALLRGIARQRARHGHDAGTRTRRQLERVVVHGLPSPRAANCRGRCVTAHAFATLALTASCIAATSAGSTCARPQLIRSAAVSASTSTLSPMSRTRFKTQHMCDLYLHGSAHRRRHAEGLRVQQRNVHAQEAP